MAKDIFILCLAIGFCLLLVVAAVWALGQIVLSDFEERDIFIQECLASEQYERDECIELARELD